MTLYRLLPLLCCLSIAISRADALEFAEPIVIDGVDNVEDMVALPNSDWIIGSGIGNWRFQAGALHLINERTSNAVRISMDLPEQGHSLPPYSDCDGPPDAELFSAHGLSLMPLGEQTSRLYVVNHGGRSAIEIFDVTLTQAAPSIQWVACIPCPEESFPNAVAARSDGSVVMSSTYRRAGFWNRLRDHSGALFIWTPDKHWREVANSALPQNNGIVLSEDEQWAFVVSMPDASVTYMPLDPNLGSAVRIPLDFYPDNIRRASGGQLVVTGVENTSLTKVNLCVVSNYRHCEIDIRADLIDPGSLLVTPLYAREGSHVFGLATVGLLTDEALWLGSVRSRHILKVPVR